MPTAPSVSHHTFKYGVPVRFSLDPGEEAERPVLDGRQTRGDVRANIPIGGFFKIFEFRGGISRYHHDELNPEGEVGSSFRTKGGELRADVVQNERAGWGGTSVLTRVAAVTIAKVSSCSALFSSVRMISICG